LATIVQTETNTIAAKIADKPATKQSLSLNMDMLASPTRVRRTPAERFIPC